MSTLERSPRTVQHYVWICVLCVSKVKLVCKRGRTYDTSVHDLDDLLVRLFHQNMLINPDLTELVLNHSKLHLMLSIFQKFVQKRRLTSSCIIQNILRFVFLPKLVERMNKSYLKIQ